jgi:hypothetical protein
VVSIHLCLMLFDQVLIYRGISARIPDGLGAGMSVGFYGTAVVNVLMEAVVFLAGWLAVSAMVMLMDGREDPRALFGWFGVAYVPLLVYSSVSYAVLLMHGGASFAGVADARSSEQLLALVQGGLRSELFTTLGWMRMAAYGVTLLLAAEATHRVSALSRLRCYPMLMAYAAFLAGVAVLTSGGK